MMFSMEMGDTDGRTHDFVGRWYLSGKYADGEHGDNDWPKPAAAVTKMREWPIYIDETPTMNIMQMRAKLRR